MEAEGRWRGNGDRFLIGVDESLPSTVVTQPSEKNRSRLSANDGFRSGSSIFSGVAVTAGEVPLSILPTNFLP